MSAYRKCTKRGRMAVLNTAETMADCGLAKNTDNERLALGVETCDRIEDYLAKSLQRRNRGWYEIEAK